MNMPYTRAPHRGDSVGFASSGGAPNAALLIDFDNVTMGMRSDLSRDLRKLLESDVIRGKVTVQRAYADWRRYPQYIVPLSENSIDLIFAPAYGSSKKNATDIRMAIDAVELVFTRPEIGTFILLTGDSDFSSCVLKLKEYGKYVIGVGIQESSSDILVQNCDEYYSYTTLTGLTKTTGGDQTLSDPWVLVSQAIRKMVERDDVMRSDRLKQVMIELDANFDEGKFGFSKFSRFITEAASRDLLVIRKLENGQYEVSPGSATPSASGAASGASSGRRERDEGRSRRSRGRGRRSSDAAEAPSSEPAGEAESGDTTEAAEVPTSPASEGLQAAYALLIRAVEALRDAGRVPARDSDVKRRLLELSADFDEAELGFSKFSRFLAQANDDGVIELTRQDGGNYTVTLREAGAPAVAAAAEAPAADEAKAQEPVVRELRPEDVVDASAPGRRLGPRGGTTRRRADEAAPVLLPGQTAEAPSVSHGAADAAPAETAETTDATEATEAETGAAATEAASIDLSSVDVTQLGLPTDPEAQVRYLSNSYRGVGKKTAEALVETFGEQLFVVMLQEPARVSTVIPAARAEALLAAFNEDVQRRAAQSSERDAGKADGEGSGSRSGGSRRGRGGRRGGRGGSRRS
jgi:uncharacterized protein (TIGR00288 family)